MPYTVDIGQIRCHVLSDGLRVVDGGGWFGLVPRALWQRVIEPNEQHQIPCDSRCLLIESDRGLILCDLGDGDKLSATVRNRLGLADRYHRLEHELATLGYLPKDIRVVVMTHMHSDHIGGGTRWEVDDLAGRVVPTFPDARYVAQRQELAAASFPNERTRGTYFAHNWEPLQQSGQLDVVDGPQQIATGVRTETAAGHTASLQVIWVEDGGEALCFLGDACSMAAHMSRLAWVPAFDLDPMMSIETKRRLQHQILRTNALVIFQHDPEIVSARLVEQGGAVAVESEIREEPWEDPLAYSVRR